MVTSTSVCAELGRRARAQRLALGMSQEAVALRGGLDRSYVGQVEQGRRNLTLKKLVALARGLQIDPADLVRGLTD